MKTLNTLTLIVNVILIVLLATHLFVRHIDKHDGIEIIIHDNTQLEDNEK